MLDDLLRQTVVELDEQRDEIMLVGSAFVPRNDSPEIFEFFGNNLYDHAATAVENLLAVQGQPTFLERAVYYNGLRPESLDALEASARRLAVRGLTELNAEAPALQRADRNPAGATHRRRWQGAAVPDRNRPRNGTGGSPLDSTIDCRSLFTGRFDSHFLIQRSVALPVDGAERRRVLDRIGTE